MIVENNNNNLILCRSNYSLLRGCLSPVDICSHAVENGYSSIGICDINNFYGLVDFIKAAESRNIKPLISTVIEVDNKPLFTALCMNKEGFARINIIITRLFADKDKSGSKKIQREQGYNPVDDLVKEGWQGLWIVSDEVWVLEKLLKREKKGVFTGLICGRPFRPAVRWARENRVPLMAFNAAVYRDNADIALYKLLRAIDMNITIDEITHKELPGTWNRFVSADRMKNFFSAVPDSMYNAERFAKECEGSILNREYIFPEFNGMSDNEAFSRLKYLCIQGVDRRYGKMREDIKKRLDYELFIIRKKGFSGYFLVVHDVVSRFPRTCGRGSSASSIVSYLLGITHVDPLKHNLFFERFLHMGKKSPPDIDIDFPWNEREKALSYMFCRYKGSAGMVADHITFGPSSCIREPARAFGMEEDEISGIMNSWRSGRYDEIPDPLLKLAGKLRGMPIHIGTHPGGIVITPQRITNYTHIQKSGTGFPVIAWEKDGAEDAGFVKIDLLGNRSLGVLRDTLSLVNKRREEPIEWENFQPLKDKKTREFIEKGNTLGIFYIESPATRRLLKKMGRGDYEHLIVASSIIRPAANKYINDYVQRLKHGYRKPRHPLIEDILKESLGIMVYQEDISRIAIAAAGFLPEEADTLRKVLSKKNPEQRLGFFKKKFFEGGLLRGISKKTLTDLWNGILSFEGYSFCKAHSASYALVSCKLAWLKMYYPLEFMVSVINNGGGFYTRQVYINAVRRMGFPVFHPDVNKSGELYTIEGRTLRSGLCQLTNIPLNFIRRIITGREKNGSYKDFFDFISRTSPSPCEIRILIRSGSLDSIAGGATRPQLFWLFFHREKRNGLFGMPFIPALKDYSKTVKIVDEIKTLDYIISCHPLDLFYNRIHALIKKLNLHLIDSRSIADSEGLDICIPGILVTEKEVRTKQKKSMSFVSFEDRYSVFETVLFPEAYSKLIDILNRGNAFIIRGTVEAEFGTYQIQIYDLICLNRSHYPVRNSIPVLSHP